MQPRVDGLERYLTTNTTQVAAELSIGSFSAADATTNAAKHRVLIVSNRGLIAAVVGTAAEAATVTYTIWGVLPGRRENANETPASGVRFKLGSMVATFGTHTATADSEDGLLVSGERFADTLVLTLAAVGGSPEGPATDFGTAFALGDAGTYSPIDNKIAYLVYPHIPAWGVIFEPTGSSGTFTDSNLLVARCG